LWEHTTCYSSYFLIFLGFTGPIDESFLSETNLEKIYDSITFNEEESLTYLNNLDWIERETRKNIENTLEIENTDLK
jgi:hypothetical protein